MCSAAPRCTFGRLDSLRASQRQAKQPEPKGKFASVFMAASFLPRLALS